MNARRAGHNYERETAQAYREIGFDACVCSRAESKNRDDQGVDLCYVGPLNIQCKRTKTAPNMQALLASMPVENGQINVVHHKRPRQGTTVTMSEGDWMEVVALLVKEGLWKV